MKVIKLAVIGAGWIGTMHARAMNNVRMCYGSDVVPELELIVDAFEDAAGEIQNDLTLGNIREIKKIVSGNDDQGCDDNSDSDNNGDDDE